MLCRPVLKAIKKLIHRQRTRKRILGTSQRLPRHKKPNLTAEEARTIAEDAVTFGIAFVANYRVFIAPLVEKHPLMMGAKLNEFANQRDLFPPETRDTTHRDTVFSLGIIDLRREPVVISVPDVPAGQVYMLQMGDTSPESLPYISTATTKNKVGDYGLVGPDFQGYLPADKFDGVITTRGQFVVMLGRTVLFDPNDLSPVHFSVRPENADIMLAAVRLTTGQRSKQ